MPGLRVSRAARLAGEPKESRATDVGDLIVAMIAVTVALLLDLLVFAFMGAH